MVKLLIENGFKIRQNHIACASRESCPMIIWKNVPKDFDSPDVDPDQPQAKAFRAPTELGHNELVDLVAKKKDKGRIPSLYEPIWPTLRKAARVCEAKISIIRYLLDKVAEQTANAKDREKMRYYDPVSCSPFSAYEMNQCCDISLRLFWGGERKFTSYSRSYDPYTLSFADFNGCNPLVETHIEMKVDPNYMDQYNQTPIMWAALAGRLETAKLLLEKELMQI
ncbi:hypothetical protein EIK77_001472 [Talaromyces pinophilus]|nr:hypothetical protein EIK77_001472 [Talaromyces pinophilus]